MKRKLIAFLLAATVLISSFAALASADAAFTDIEDHWAKDSINWAANEGLVNGVGNGRYDPNTPISRGMMAVVLWRLEGSPAPTVSAPFTDLSADWYKSAVIWAYEKGIVNGNSPSTFAPDLYLTREQAATFFYRYSAFKNFTIYKRADLSDFPDSSLVSSWAADALSWANAEGLINGTNKGNGVTLSPQDVSDRAQLAVLLQRFSSFIDRQPHRHTAISTANRYYYQTLTRTQQKAYLAIDQAVKNFDYIVSFNQTLTPNDVITILNAYFADQPEKWYLGTGYGHDLYVGNATIYLSYGDGVTDTFDEVNRVIVAPDTALINSIRAKDALLLQKVEQIVSSIPVHLAPVEKQKMIHDYLICNSRYSYWVLPDNLNEVYLPMVVVDEWTACGVLLNKSGVCESYAEAFQLLCYQVGIPCTSVVGLGNDMPHKWNAVYLDEEWYLCDVTFDDPIFNNPDGSDNYLDGPFDKNNIDPFNHYGYFNCTDANALYTHKADETMKPPSCKGTRYSYKNYFGSAA